MNQHHTIGHVGYSPDYKTPRVKGYWENMEYINGIKCNVCGGSKIACHC